MQSKLFVHAAHSLVIEVRCDPDFGSCKQRAHGRRWVDILLNMEQDGKQACAA
jgi:hypothetical protein